MRPNSCSSSCSCAVLATCKFTRARVAVQTFARKPKHISNSKPVHKLHSYIQPECLVFFHSMLMKSWHNVKYEELNSQARPASYMRRVKMLGRRHLSSGHFLCRLPTILLSAIIVILVLYKSIKSTYHHDHEAFNDLQHKSAQLFTQSELDQTEPLGLVSQDDATTNQLLIRPSGKIEYEQSGRHDKLIKSFADNELKVTSDASGRAQLPLTTTRRSPVRDYLRRSEIFILIVQDGDIISRADGPNMPNSRSNFYPIDDIRLDVTKSKGWHKFSVPAHIRQLIDVLKSHRIDYTLDIMRSVLPIELLQNPKKYSVIVVDDFIKYDRLNRWARDQLDRYCRSHNIGVITYLIDTGKPDYHQFNRGTTDSILSNSKSSNTPKNAHTSSDISSQTKVTIEQYPISFELFNLNCRNETSISCLVDYQLNDKTQMLRILKRKPDFTLKGELDAILGSSSVMTMTSSHVTHEPLTWARLRRPLTPTHILNKRYARSSTNETKPAMESTQHEDHDRIVRRSRRTKRAVLPNPTQTTSGYASDLNGDKKQVNSFSVNGSPFDEFLGDSIVSGRVSKSHHETKTEQSSDQREEPLSNSYSPINDLDGKRVIAMLDNGLYDGIRRVIFGIANQHWLDRLLLLDAIEHLSSGEILTPLERYIQIDIDDIFVGASGTRMNESDVFALVEAQTHFATLIEDGFKFNLGFSGKYFMHGSETEQLGDKQLIANSEKFTWFCHFWSHSKAHLFNSTEELSLELNKNLKFAQDNKLTLIGHREPLAAQHVYNDHQQPPTYAVAPHHSGVYPIHEQLYEAWRSILNVQVTSTEEYPHLRPANQRRGFVHETIKVLPRQTCGLYTHTIYKNKYPGGFNKLVSNIQGGELFETIVHNPVNIYMTHMSNYANDRLALFTFKSLFEFVQENTNLRLRYSPSVTVEDSGKGETEQSSATGAMFLADYYFSLHPEEREPLWTNPCDDKRHLAIWSASKLKYCPVVPKLLIVGPQKTGTTALQSFLKLNPSIRTSSISSQDFEEVQFFNDKHYFKGSGWYFERFLSEKQQENETTSSQDDDTIFLDKSATYFDDPKVPRRASSLLPDAYIVILLINPADRAYSWYQHIKAHGDPLANEFSFDDVIMFQDAIEPTVTSSSVVKLNETSSNLYSSPRGRTLTDHQRVAMKALRNRCLHPGYYSNHLLKWLNFYQSRQIIIIDGEFFKLNPVAVLDRLQLLLRLPKQVDYNKLLVYQKSKGFFCEKTGNSIGSRRQSQDLDNDVRAAASGLDEQEDIIKCLGTGKGRKYPPMSSSARKYLEEHYLSHNIQLARLMFDIGQSLPRWLHQSIDTLTRTTFRLF